MNAPPTTSVLVAHGHLHVFTAGAFRAVSMPQQKADFLAGLLVANDLRGVHSHGTQNVGGYTAALRDGNLNPDPNVTVLLDGPTTLQLDGDGGLGYFAAYDGTLRIVEKVKELGIAVLSTRNHGHIGAAGIYARLAAEHGLLSFVTSGYDVVPPPGAPYHHAGGNPPMCFGTPLGEEDPLVVDFGTTSDLHREELGLAEAAPGLVFRCVGMAAVAHMWGHGFGRRRYRQAVSWRHPGVARSRDEKRPVRTRGAGHPRH